MVSQIEKIGQAVLVLNQKEQLLNSKLPAASNHPELPSLCRALVPVLMERKEIEKSFRFRSNPVIAAHLKACIEGGRNSKSMRLGHASQAYGRTHDYATLEQGVLI